MPELVLEKKNRIWEFDFLRGLAIILVAFDHSMITIQSWFGELYSSSGNGFLEMLYNFADIYVESSLRMFFWPVFVFIFFFISGACTRISKNNFKRGFKLLAVAGFVTWITYMAEIILAFEGAVILFGVLHCLAFCILIFAIFELVLTPIKNKKIKGIIYCVIGLALEIYCLAKGMGIYQISYDFKTLDNENLLIGLFLYTKQFAKITSDYFPLLPYISYFFIGGGLANLLYRDKASIMPKLEQKVFGPIIYCGQKSLWIYIGVQGVALIVFGALALLFTGKLM